MSNGENERFDATAGSVSGWMIVGLCGLVAVAGFFDGSGVAPWAVALSGFVGVLAWAAIVRPRLEILDRTLVMRGIVDHVTIPLQLIDKVQVQQFTAVWVDGKRYSNSSVGRTRRELVRDPLRAAAPEKKGEVSYGYFVEERLNGQIAEAKRDARAAPDRGVERRRDWWVVVVLGVLVVVTVVLLLV